MRTLTRRLQALLLLLTLVGGSFALPLYDAAVYHSGLTSVQPRANSVAGESATTTHNVTCAIDLASRCGTGIAPVTNVGLAPSVPARSAVLLPTQFTPPQTWLASTHSRAPPSSLS